MALAIAYQAVASVCLDWSAPFLPVADWATGQLATRHDELPEALRLVLADLALQRGDSACRARHCRDSMMA